MSKFVEEIKPKLDQFITEQKSKTQYSKLSVEVIIQDNNSDGLSITSNAGMWISHSNMLAKEITDFIRHEYEKSAKEPTAINIRFSKDVQPLQSGKLLDEKQKESKVAGNMEQAEFIPQKPKYKLEDVILPEETANDIKEAISTIESFDMVYNKWNFKSKEPSAKTNICFFGAPGTGKTMCAHAIAHSLGKDILIASYADIQSQYVGVGPKNLKAVFQTAEEKNALLFFDEADSFLRKRTSDSSSSASMHYNSMTNEMMKHLEDFNGIVIFATNLTENTDEAFKTRLSFSIEFKVPDEKCRAKIIEGMIPPEVPLSVPFTENDYVELSKACEGFVGRDIRNSVKTILSIGAQNNEFPFTKQQFLDGFQKYKENKASFDKSSGTSKDQKSNPMDIYTANGCIHNLLTYIAWVDGKENDVETEYLKLFSKVLSRTKLIINSVNDLPEFEEICHEITDFDLKKRTMRYLAYFMANTNQTESLYNEYSRKLSSLLSLDANFLEQLDNYYRQSKELALLKESINDIKSL